MLMLAGRDCPVTVPMLEALEQPETLGQADALALTSTVVLQPGNPWALVLPAAVE
jgi:hypothetical protein